MQPAKDQYSFLYDIFLSHNMSDESAVKALREMYDTAGIRTFFAPHNLQRDIGKSDWEKSIFEALEQSHHLGIYCTTGALLSDWVQKEVNHFKAHIESRRAIGESLILVIADPGVTAADFERIIKTNSILEGLLRPKDATHALQIITKRRIAILSGSLTSAQSELQQTRNLARQAFEYYSHARFWKPFAQDRDNLHVFTCGRDTPEDKGRGTGGRTNIDKWDYQSAIDITHYFARHYRSIGVQIEQPVSKARIDKDTRAFDTTAFSSQLACGNCVVIGSPDVSDFAEITLAKLLNVKPYEPGMHLESGFKIIKDGPRFSTFYESSSTIEEEGIRLISSAGDVRSYVITPDRSYGVMVLADNPFSPPTSNNKILILAGHSGIATRAISLLLTNEESWCLDEFYELDQKLAVMSGPIAAVIEVQFGRQGRPDQVGDDRLMLERPGKIRFMHAVSLELKHGSAMNYPPWSS